MQDTRKRNAKMRALGQRAPRIALQIDAEVVRKFFQRARRARRRSCASFSAKVARVFCDFCVDFMQDTRKRNANRASARLVQRGVRREPMTVLVRFLRFLVDFGKGFAHNLAIIAKKILQVAVPTYRRIDASRWKNRSMRRCVCEDQKSLRFTLYFGFDYVVVLAGWWPPAPVLDTKF